MIDTWFRDLLNERVNYLADHKGRGGVTALAKFLEMPRETVDRWASGSSLPDVLVGAKVLEKLGGKIDRAMPDWETTGSAPELEVCGQVQAGGVELAGECIYTVPGVSEAAWKGSRYWKQTYGRTILTEVQGDSMAPEYQEGELLACRQPVSARDIKDGTPCIFREGNRYTFKILRRTKDKRVIGYPLNPAHMPIIFDASDEVRVEYVVLGKIDLGKKKR